MPASSAASDKRATRTFASFKWKTRECDWPLWRSENEVTIGEIQVDLRLWFIQSAADWDLRIVFVGRTWEL
jgi:hypothetical protein